MGHLTRFPAMILVLASAAAAVDQNPAGWDCTYLNDVPGAIKTLAEAQAITDRDSSPDISAKNQTLFNGLMDIERQLMRRYYLHDQMVPKDIDAIPLIARLRANLEYPLSSTAGCTMHDYFEDDYRVNLILTVILQTAHRIRSTADRQPFGPIAVLPTPSTEWDKSWTLAVAIIQKQLPSPKP